MMQLILKVFIFSCTSVHEFSSVGLDNVYNIQGLGFKSRKCRQMNKVASTMKRALAPSKNSKAFSLFDVTILPWNQNELLF